MGKIIIKIDADNGYACPDNKVLNYVQDAITYAKEQNKEYHNKDYTICIGTILLYDAFRLSHVRKEYDFVFMIGDDDLEMSVYGQPTKFREDYFNPFESAWNIPTDMLREAVKIRTTNKYKDINPIGN